MQSRKKIIVVSAVLLVALLLAVAYVWFPRNSANSQPQAEPTTFDSPAFTNFTNQYLGIMQNLNSSETKVKMASLLEPNFNQTDLFIWEENKLTFVQDSAGSLVDPFQILNSGEGICLQWSIVYVSACLALGYQSRLVVAVDTSTWEFIHVWAEDYYNGTWVHVDPSDKVWNDPSRYLSWDWGKYIGSEVKIYAFEDNQFQDVTFTYSAHSN